MRPPRRTDSAGLGLVGLLAVVVLLALLAAGAFVALRGASSPTAATPAGAGASVTTAAAGAPTTNAVDATRVAACQALAAEVQTALTLYQAQHGGYPSSLAALVPGLLKSDPATALASGQSLGYSAASGTLSPHCA